MGGATSEKTDGSGWHKKVGQVSHESIPSFMFWASVSVSGFLLWVSALSCQDGV